MAEGEIPTDSKGRKGLCEALFDTVGSLSYLVGSVVLIAIAVGTIGGIFMSTRRFFQFKRAKRDEYNSSNEPEGGVGKATSNG